MQPCFGYPGQEGSPPVLGYLSEQELDHLLAQINRLAKHGERDYVLLSLLYDTGARIQELLDLTPRDFHLETPPFVRLRGKDVVNAMPITAAIGPARTHIPVGPGRRVDEQEPLLQNGRRARLTRHGARYILLKYVRRATSSMPTLSRPGISPHSMRHTKGMHLLQSGVPLVMVKDFLGHVDLKSTEVYVQADLEMKRKALNLSNAPQPTQAPEGRLSSSLIEWLEAL
jgi:site-specific recombinase XerD